MTTNVTAFPTDPTGGTALILTDDSYAPVNLTGGKSVSLYGTSRTNLFVGSNGYITFDSGDSEYRGTYTYHFGKPRVSGFFADYNPGSGGTISVRQLDDRLAATWQNVPEYDTTNSNNFQVELFFDGVIRITWLRIDIPAGVAGLSQGLGVPAGFAASDLSAYPVCTTTPTGLLISATATGRGNIEPWGLVPVSLGADASFTALADTYFHIGDVRTNGTVIAQSFDAASTNFVFGWTNIAADGSIIAHFVETTTTNGTPWWWLAQYGLTNGGFDAAAAADPDHDGFSSGREFVADTRPDDSNSFLRIAGMTGGSNAAVNLATTSSNRLYAVYGATNLTSGVWTTLATNVPGSGPSTSVGVTNDVPWRAYRIGVRRP